MQLKLFKTISHLCAFYCIAIGILYLFFWHFTIVDVISIGLAYYGAITIILMGIGLLLFYNSSPFPYLKCLAAIIFILTAIKTIEFLFPLNPFLHQYLFFYSEPNPLNILGFGLTSTCFFVWTKTPPSQFRFLYCFFVACTCMELGVLGILAHILGFSVIYGNTHLVGIISLIVVGFGTFCTLIYFELLYRVNLYKWIPFTTGIVICIFFIIFAFGIYINEQSQLKFHNVLIVVTLLGGVFISINSSMLIYFFLLSKTQLKKVVETEALLEKAKEEEQSALRSAGVGTWRLDLQTNKLQADDMVYQLLGIKPEALDGTLKNFLTYIHPDDQPLFRSALRNSIKLCDPFDVCHRFASPIGGHHFLHIKGKVTFDNKGTPQALTGIIIDETEVKSTQSLLQLSVSITKVFERAISISDAAKQLLCLFHSHFGWELMAIWMRDSPQDELQCLALESRKNLSNTKTLENYVAEHTAWIDHFLEMLTEKAKPIPIENLDNAFDFLSSLSTQERFLGGIICPILDGSQIIGVVELFKNEPYKEKIDVNLSDFFIATGIGIGEYVKKIHSFMVKEDLAKIVIWSHEPIFSCTLDGKILNWNPSAETLFGWKAKEIIGANIEVLFPSDRLKELEMLKQTFNKGADNYKIQSQRKTKEGKLLWVDETYSTFIDTEGERTRVSIIVRDITEEKMAQEALKRADEKYRTFVETTDEWIWEIDKNGIVTYSNPAITKILEYTPEEVIGQPVEFFAPEENKKVIRMNLENAVYTKTGQYHQLTTLKNKSGKLRILEGSSMPILNEKNELTGFRGAHKDVTEREEIEKHKNEFLSMVSHEIKTPLTSIHGALGLLSIQSDLPTKTKELIQLAFRNSAFLSQLTQDIVDVEKIDLGKFEIILKNVDLSKLIKEAIKTASLIAEKKKLSLVELSTIPDLIVMADPERLLQVFFNLFSNAINFSPVGGNIYISTELFGDKVRVTIRDEGPGIPEEFRARIFRRFEKAFHQFTDYRKGTGLGLNISKTIIEEMGGTINYISAPQKGASFYFELPLSAPLPRYSEF